MENKKYVWIIGVLIVSTFVIAQSVELRNRNKDLTRVDYLVAKKLGLDEYNVTNTKIGTTHVERCLVDTKPKNIGTKAKPEWIDINVINKCKKFPRSITYCNETISSSQECGQWVTENYNKTQMFEFMDTWEDNTIMGIINATKERILERSLNRTIEQKGKTRLRER